MRADDVTVVFGYSDNELKYSFKAYHLLKEFGFKALSFSPRADDFSKIPDSFNTLTMYVSSEISSKFKDQILSKKFNRIIFNPGSENPELEKICLEKKIEVVHGCTLVMLKTDQY